MVVNNGTDDSGSTKDRKNIDVEEGAQKGEEENANEQNQMAILLLNYQNEFVKKGGNLYGEIAEVVEEIGVLQNAPQLVQFAREMETLVIYSPVVMKATQNFNEVEASTSFHTNKYSKQDGLFIENTWNCEIAFEVEPRNDDIILHDRSDFSAFAGTKLQSILKDNKINHFFVIILSLLLVFSFFIA